MSAARPPMHRAFHAAAARIKRCQMMGRAVHSAALARNTAVTRPQRSPPYPGNPNEVDRL
ncbi:hypothetical protein KCH_64550 [Kitasatospora cheerisanensis KCTC 2395]|uniref:Uncharacterized protein n=1 Tax=Kitasatospora cheerisanensis KCTC 2395 TaxID=1348663 RepID=A0A066YV01_9ACTN|nr:hypothetical protein KCH_64550 [Kitasatospora cheerisanensis KCTC 2395]